MRGIGLPGALEGLPGLIVVLFALITQLGDLWFLALVTMLVYWLVESTPRVGDGLDRERTATLVALLFGAIALLVTLKPAFGFPRPPGADVAPRAAFVPEIFDAVYAWLSTGTGYGFPSGHALGSTVVFGGLAWAIRAGDRRRRITLAGALVVLVSASRLVLGVHYLVDVLAGAAIGLVYLAVVVRVLGTPRRAFGLATAVALVGALAFSFDGEIVAVTGVCVGGTAVWLAAEDRLVALSPSPRGGVITLVLGLATAGPLLAVVGTAELLSWLPALVAGLVGGALVVALPLVGDALAKK